MEPQGIQRKRTKGYDMQAVSVALNGLQCVSVTPPSRWGNPFWDIKRYGRDLVMAAFENTARGLWDPTVFIYQPKEVVAWFRAQHRAWLARIGTHPVEEAQRELRGKHLACYCSLNQSCHRDVLLKIANE